MSLAPNPDIIPVQTARNLVNNLYDKRKLGALEVEQLVRAAHAKGNTDQVKHIIDHLNKEFVQSANGNAKKGGLIGFAACALGLGSDTRDFVELLLPPVLSCFSDHDMRTRYYACESLYNIAKIAHASILPFFNEIFDGLSKLSADPDQQNVKPAASLLDRLVKDIVVDVGTFDVERFIPLLRERIFVINPFCREFIVAWISVLDEVPSIDMLKYLPQLLDGLFSMLQDTSEGIRAAVDTVLAEFLREIRDDPAAADLGSLTKTLLASGVGSSDDFTRLTALVYIAEFIQIGGVALLDHTPALVRGILPSVAHSSDNVAGAAVRANDALLNLLRSADDIKPILTDLLNVLLAVVAPKAAPADRKDKHADDVDAATIAPRLAALRWLTQLHAMAPEPLGQLHSALLSPLLAAAADGSELLARRALELLATLSADDATRLDALLRNVMRNLADDAALLDNRGTLIVRQLALHVPSERVLRRLSVILEQDDDLDFAAVMVDTLNLILLTAPELSSARRKLRGLQDADAADFFTALYPAWAHSPAALLSLSLLCGVYEHASQLILLFANVTITVGFLMQVDKLVQLIESPVFVHLRLQLLEPQENAYLFKTLYGLLMLLPQSSAFELLRSRLNCITTLGTLQLMPAVKPAPKNAAALQIKFGPLLDHFRALQGKREAQWEARQLAAAKSNGKT